MIEIGELYWTMCNVYCTSSGMRNEQANSKFVRWFDHLFFYVQKRMRNKKGWQKHCYFHLIFPLYINLIVAFWLEWCFSRPLLDFVSISLPHFKHAKIQHFKSWRLNGGKQLSIWEWDKKAYLPPEQEKRGKQFSNWHINYVYFADAPIFIECDQI